MRVELLAFGLRSFPVSLGLRGALFGGGKFFARGSEAVFVFEANGCGLRRVGAADETIPAPKIALARDQTRAGLQVLGERRTSLGIDDASKGEARGELRRRFDEAVQRLRSTGKVRLRRVSAGPACGGLGVGGGVDVVTQG